MTTRGDNRSQDNSLGSSDKGRGFLVAQLRRLLPEDAHLRVLIVTVILVFLILAALNPRVFLGSANMHSMGIQVSEIGLLTLAMAATMMIAGIDLSVTATANLSAIIGGLVMQQMLSAGGGNSVLASFVGIVVIIVVGSLLGLFNGILISVGRVTPILATMATLMLYQGIGTVLTDGISIFGFPNEILNFGLSSFLFVPGPLLIFICAAVIMWLILNRRPIGLQIRLAGSNNRAAAFAGISNRRIILIVHTTAGFLASLAGLISLIRTNSANAQYGSSYILMSILIAVLGGISIFGGKGTVGGVVLALALVQLLGSGMNIALIRVTRGNFFQNIIWGILLLSVLSSLMWLVSRKSRKTRPPGTSKDRTGSRVRSDG